MQVVEGLQPRRIGSARPKILTENPAMLKRGFIFVLLLPLFFLLAPPLDVTQHLAPWGPGTVWGAEADLNDAAFWYGLALQFGVTEADLDIQIHTTREINGGFVRGGCDAWSELCWRRR